MKTNADSEDMEKKRREEPVEKRKGRPEGLTMTKNTTTHDAQ